MVFTIPKRLRVFFRYDRELLGELAKCSWRALRLYFEAYFDGADVTPGAVGFVQTAGELLNFHPHIHVLVTDGGFRPDGTFRPLAWFDSRHVERLFRAEGLRRLLDMELITAAVVDNLLSWRHSGPAISALAIAVTGTKVLREQRFRHMRSESSLIGGSGVSHEPAPYPPVSGALPRHSSR